MALKFENSNIAQIGSSADLQQRVAAAKTEKEWEGAGSKVGIEIWRIEKFNIKKWPVHQYGSFYDGDSYIVLSTYLEKNRMCWDVHFWLGRECTQDERGTAAYKTVELDDLLGTIPVQHREVQGYESKLFTSYFNNHLTILKGGIESGFHHVGPKEYKPRLMHIKGKRRVTVTEVDISPVSLNKGDAFILDNGLTIYKWLPGGAGITEKYHARMTAEKMKGQRKNSKVVELAEAGSEEFWGLLGGKDGIKEENEVPSDEVFDKMELDYVKQMYQLSDESGKMVFTKVMEGKLDKAKMVHDDVMIIDTGTKVICWIGSGASKDEKLKAVMYAQEYLTRMKRPCYIPITRVMDGKEGMRFQKIFE